MELSVLAARRTGIRGESKGQATTMVEEPNIGFSNIHQYVRTTQILASLL
jgi:hypothetical protein